MLLLYCLCTIDAGSYCIYVTYTSGGIFYRVLYVELYTDKPVWWNLLTFMLDTSPK